MFVVLTVLHIQFEKKVLKILTETYKCESPLSSNAEPLI